MAAADASVPRKGILKSSSNFEEKSKEISDKKEAKWDEMNILATYHPTDKDYGYQKIDEAPTPYNRLSFSENDDDEPGNGAVRLDEESFAATLQLSGEAKVFQRAVSTEDDDAEDVILTEEELVKRKAFEDKRKRHYNEFLEAKRIREVLSQEDDGDEDAEEKEELGGDSGMH